MKYRNSVRFQRNWISDSIYFHPADLEGEVWVNFAEYQGHHFVNEYQISNKGRIKRKESNEILKGSISFDGYHEISIEDSSNIRVHRAVLYAFKGCPPKDMPSPTCQHVNHDKLDNRIENLCWMSAFDNNQEGHGVRCKVIDTAGEHIFPSQKVASSYLGRYQDYISECVNMGYKLTNKDGEEVDVYTEVDREWVKYIRPDPKNRTKCRLKIDDQTLDFESFHRCDEFLGRYHGWISGKIYEGRPVVEEKEHTFYIYNYDTLLYEEYIPTKTRKRNHSNQCQLVDSDNRTRCFESISSAARYIGRDPEYLRIAIRDNKVIKDNKGDVVAVTLL